MQMTDDTLVPPYSLQPGQNVTIISKYSADENHYGEEEPLDGSQEMCCTHFVSCFYSPLPCSAVLPYSCLFGGTLKYMLAVRSGSLCAGVMALWILTVTNWDPTCPGGET